MPILGANSSGGSRPSTPTIGTASDGGTGTTASVAFTPSTYIGKGTINYTVTSSPGNITASGSSSPITVTGLTTGTAYTFTVQGTTNYGVTSAVSSASNSMTPVNPITYDMDLLATSTATGTNIISFTGLSSAYNTFIVRGYYTAAVEGLSFVGGRFNGLTANYKYNNNVVTWTGSANAISAWGNTNSASSIVLQQALSGTSTPVLWNGLLQALKQQAGNL
jgi:trimeric autotransporter adhesin